MPETLTPPASSPADQPDTSPTTPRPAGTLPAPLDSDSLINHRAEPPNLESHREVLDAEILESEGLTPLGRLFVRSNLELPPASILECRDAWEVEIKGVASPRTLTLAELKELGEVTLVSVMQCAGNGRAFFEHEPFGIKWEVGAVGNLRWTGVPVRAVLDALGGAADGAGFLTVAGAEPLPDEPNGADRLVERSIPLAKGMADAVLAWEANGEPLPLVYGGPLRLVVPGYYGINHVKWLKRLACTAEETTVRIQRSTYRVRPIGERSSPTQPTMWEMNVKSLVTAPLASSVSPGSTTVRGIAFSGTGPVTGVDVSLDGGASWRAAELLAPDLGPFAWRRFALDVELAAGHYRIVSRARDAAGNVQPEHRAENGGGYGHNGWSDPAVEIEVGQS